MMSDLLPGLVAVAVVTLGVLVLLREEDRVGKKER